jgi:hypothetical protein
MRRSGRGNTYYLDKVGVFVKDGVPHLCINDKGIPAGAHFAISNDPSVSWGHPRLNRYLLRLVELGPTLVRVTPTRREMNAALYAAGVGLDALADMETEDLLAAYERLQRQAA